MTKRPDVLILISSSLILFINILILLLSALKIFPESSYVFLLIFLFALSPIFGIISFLIGINSIRNIQNMCLRISIIVVNTLVLLMPILLLLYLGFYFNSWKGAWID